MHPLPLFPRPCEFIFLPNTGTNDQRVIFFTLSLSLSPCIRLSSKEPKEGEKRETERERARERESLTHKRKELPLPFSLRPVQYLTVNNHIRTICVCLSLTVCLCVSLSFHFGVSYEQHLKVACLRLISASCLVSGKKMP